jgi:hypothetical protein
MGFHFGLYDVLGLLFRVAILAGVFVLLRKLFSKQ